MFGCFNKDAFFFLFLVLTSMKYFLSFFYLLRLSCNSLCFFIFFVFIFHVSFFFHARKDSIRILIDLYHPLILWVSFEIQDQSKLWVLLVIDDSL